MQMYYIAQGFNNNNDTLIKRLTSKRPLGALQNVNYKYKKCEKI